MFNIVVGIVLQTSLVALPILFFVKEFTATLIALSLIVIPATMFNKTRHDKLYNRPEEEIAREKQTLSAT